MHVSSDGCSPHVPLQTMILVLILVLILEDDDDAQVLLPLCSTM
jgi:hypothetical protein